MRGGARPTAGTWHHEGRGCPPAHPHCVAAVALQAFTMKLSGSDFLAGPATGRLEFKNMGSDWWYTNPTVPNHRIKVTWKRSD